MLLVCKSINLGTANSYGTDVRSSLPHFNCTKLVVSALDIVCRIEASVPVISRNTANWAETAASGSTRVYLVETCHI